MVVHRVRATGVAVVPEVSVPVSRQVELLAHFLTAKSAENAEIRNNVPAEVIFVIFAFYAVDPAATKNDNKSV
jgi:hypothetical protein